MSKIEELKELVDLLKDVAAQGDDAARSVKEITGASSAEQLDEYFTAATADKGWAESVLAQLREEIKLNKQLNDLIAERKAKRKDDKNSAKYFIPMPSTTETRPATVAAKPSTTDAAAVSGTPSVVVVESPSPSVKDRVAHPVGPRVVLDSAMIGRLNQFKLRNPKLRAAITNSAPIAARAGVPSFPDIPNPLEGLDLASITEEQIQQVTKEYVERYGQEMTAHFEAISKALGISYAAVSLEKHQAQMQLGTNTLKMDYRALISNFIRSAASKKRNPKVDAESMQIWDDGSTAPSRRMGIFATLGSYIKNIFSHEVGHFDQGNLRNIPGIKTAQVEMAARRIEPSVMQSIYGDTQEVAYSMDPVTYPSQAGDESVSSRATRQLANRAWEQTFKAAGITAYALATPEPERKKLLTPPTGGTVSTDTASRATTVDDLFDGYAFSATSVNPSVDRSYVQRRPANLTNVDKVVKWFSEQFTTQEAVERTASTLGENSADNLLELARLITRYRRAQEDKGSERANLPTYANQINSLFKNLFPRNPVQINEKNQSMLVNDLIIPYLQEIARDTPELAQITETVTAGKATSGQLLRIFKQIIGSVVTSVGESVVPVGKAVLGNLTDQQLIDNIPKLTELLRPLLTKKIVNPDVVMSLADYQNSDVVASTIAPIMDLGDLVASSSKEMVGANMMSIKDADSTASAAAPSSMTGALSSREFIPQFVRGIGIRLYRAIDSWKESLRSGSVIEGLGNTEVFPTGFETTLTTALQQLSEQVNAEIDQGMLETRQIGGNEVTLPKTVAGKLSEIVLDTSRMATHSTLIGRLGNKRGPVGALVTGDPIQKFLNLFLASVMQKLRRGEQITGKDVKDFLTQTVTPDQATDADGNLLDGPVAGNSVTVAETMALRLADSLEYNKQRALTQMVATSSNPAESGVWRSEAIRLTQEQKVLDLLLKKDQKFENDDARTQAEAQTNAEIRGQLLNQGAPFTREQALAYLFGTNAARQEYNDAAYPIIDYASTQMSGLVQAGVAVPTGYFRPNSRMRRLIDYTQKGHTEAAKGQLVPTLDRQIEEIKSAENAFQEKDQILEAIEQAYGIPFVTSLLNASRVAADDSGTILQGQDLIKGLGGSGFAGRRFESIVGFSSGIESIANFGIDAVDFARLMTNTDLTDEQMEARGQLALKFPELAGLSQDDLKKLSELDLEKESSTDLIRKIFKILGPKIKAKVDALVRQAAKDAGYSDDDATNWITTGNNVPQGFENLVGAARLFDSSRTAEQKVEIGRAVALAQNLVSQYLQSGDTTATALARLTDNTEMMDTLTPKLAEDAVGSVSAGYSVVAKASDIMADQTGRPQSNIYRRTTVAVRNAERVQREIDEVNEEIRLLEQAKSEAKSKSKISAIEKDLIAANRRRDSLSLQLRKEQESVPQDRITKRMEQLRSIASISPNTVEGARAATELAIREATRKITGRYNIEGDEGFGTDSLEDRFRRLVEYTDLEQLSSRTPDQQRRFDELQAQRSMRQRQYQGEETQDTIFTVWTPEQQVSTETSDVIRGTSLRPLIQNAREVSSDNEEIPVSNFPVEDMVRLATQVTPEQFSAYGKEYAELKQEAKLLEERITTGRLIPNREPWREQQLRADEQRFLDVFNRAKELEAQMAHPSLLPMNDEEQKKSQKIKVEADRLERWYSLLEQRKQKGEISEEKYKKINYLLDMRRYKNQDRAWALLGERRDRAGFNPLHRVQTLVDLVFTSIEQYSTEMDGGASGFSLDTAQAISELMTQVRAEGVREAPAGASSATQRIEEALPQVLESIITAQGLPNIDRTYTSAEIKEAKDYLASIRGKDKLTPEETRKRSAMRARLFQQASTEISTRFKDNKGVLDVVDMAVTLLPTDWQTNDVQADQAYTLAEMLQGLSPVQLAALSNVDITNPHSLAALVRREDPQLSSLGLMINQINNTDASVRSRIAFRRGTQRTRQAQNVSENVAAARASLAEVRGVNDFYFDLETDYGDVDPSNRHIAQAAFTDQSGQVDEVFGVATDAQIDRLIELKNTAKNEADFIKSAMSIFNEDADGNQMAEGPSQAVLQRAAEVAYRSQYLTAHVMTQQDIREMLQERIEQADRVIGHNIAGFDLPAVYGGTVPSAVSAKVQDTLPMSRRQYIGDHTLSGTYKYVTGKDLSNAHTAGADVAATMEVFQALSKMLTPQEAAELRLLQEEEARLAALELSDDEKKVFKELEEKLATRGLGKKDQERFNELTTRYNASKFGTRLSEEKRARKRQLEAKQPAASLPLTQAEEDELNSLRGRAIVNYRTMAAAEYTSRFEEAAKQVEILKAKQEEVKQQYDSETDPAKKDAIRDELRKASDALYEMMDVRDKYENVSEALYSLDEELVQVPLQSMLGRVLATRHESDGYRRLGIPLAEQDGNIPTTPRMMLAVAAALDRASRQVEENAYYINPKTGRRVNPSNKNAVKMIKNILGQEVEFGSESDIDLDQDLSSVADDLPLQALMHSMLRKRSAAGPFFVDLTGHQTPFQYRIMLDSMREEYARSMSTVLDATDPRTGTIPEDLVGRVINPDTFSSTGELHVAIYRLEKEAYEKDAEERNNAQKKLDFYNELAKTSTLTDDQLADRDTAVRVLARPFLHDKALEDLRGRLGSKPILQLSEEEEARKEELEARQRNAPQRGALQRLMSLGDPRQDPQAAKEMAAAFAYVNPLQQMLDFTDRVQQAAISGGSLDSGTDDRVSDVINRVNKMFANQLKETYGVADARDLNATQLAEFSDMLTESFINPNSGLLVDVTDLATNTTKKSFYPIKAFLQEMMNGNYPISGSNSGYANSVPLLQRFGSLEEIMAAAGTIGIQAALDKGKTFPEIDDLATQMLAGTDTSRQAAMVGTARPRNPAVTSAVRTASVGTGEGGAGFGGGGDGGGSGGGGMGDGEMGGGFRSVTIANATIQSMTANSIGITLQGGSIVLNGQKVEVGQKGGSGSYSSSDDLVVRSVANRLALQRTRVTEQLSKEKDSTVRTQIQEKAMQDFARIAFAALRSETGIAGRQELGNFAKFAGEFKVDPLGSLEKYSNLVEQKYISSQKELEALSTKTDLTDEEKQRLDELTASNASLARFVGLIKELRTQLEYTTKAVNQTREPYERTTTSPAYKAANTTVSNVSGRRDRFTQASLQAARNVFDQSMGSAGGRYGFQGRAELTRATSDYVLQMMKSSGSVESVIDPATGAATLRTTLGFDPAAVGSGVDVSGINAAADMITQELKRFAASTDIESTMSSFSRLNESLQVARDALVRMANDDTLDPNVREQAATQLKILDDATYASSEGGRELERTEKALTSQRSKQIQTLRERLQANATENLALGPIDPRRRIREYRMISDFLKTTVNEEGYKELFGTGTLMAVSAKNPKNRINLRDASYEDILATSQRLSEVGSEMSVESLQSLQRAVNESEQQRNQSPYAQSFNWLVNQGQNIQQVGMWAQSLFNLPQTLTGMVQQFAEPQLNVVRTLTSARALSLDASKYSQVLGAASNLQQRFGGTITGQLGQITSFIPLTNTYGVDIDEVVNVARKLAAFDPAQGMEGASIAIKEFLSGNVASLSRRFELNRSSLTKINMGDPQKMLDSLNDLLNGMGITDRLIDEQANSLATKYDKMLGKLDQVYINLSSIAVEQITPYLDQLTNGTDGGLLGIDLSGFARDKVFETMSKQQAAGAADEALIGPNGLDSIDLSGDTAKFAKSVDTVLREANKAMGGVSETYNTVLGTPAQFDAYRLLGNMTGAERVRVQAAAQKNVGAGMTTSQAILQALRDVGGDYNQNQVLMGFRRQLGFYDGVALDAQQQEKLVKTLGQSNFEGWSELTRNFDSVEVLDADTVEVTVKDENGNEKRERIRLAGIDAFEKGTPESDAAIAFVRQALSNKSFSVSSAGLDKYGRTVSMINVDGMNLNAELIRQGMASVGYTDMEGTAFTPEMRTQFEQLQLAAANSGVGPINKDAAEMGLGALPILSEQAKENVYQKQYGLGNILGGAMGVGSGATIASIVTKLALAGGFTMPAALAPGGASFGGALAASVTNPAFWVPILAGAVVGGGALAYTDAKNREAYNADSSLETVRAQYQEQLKLDQEAMNETRANRYAQFYKYEVTDADIANAQRAQIESAGPSEITSIPDYFKLGIYPNTIRPYDPLKVVNEQETKILKAANEKASEAYTNYYNSMTDQQKEVEKMFKINPFSGERERISAIRNQIDTYTAASKESRLAADMLSTYSESITEFTDSTTVLTNNIDTFNNAVASGMVVRLPVTGAKGKTEKVKLTQDIVEGASADTLRSILDQIPKVRMSTYQQEAKNYLDQSMEQQLQLRQTRLQNRMDSIGKLSLTAAPLRGAMLASAGTPSYASGAGVGEYYDDMIQGIPTYSEEAILKLLFKVDLEEGQAKSDILDAARQAMKLAQDQLKTFQEQEMLTYMVDLQYGTTMKNFVTAFNMNPKASMDYLSLLGQGNPRFAFDYTDQMMGINPKQMFMQGFTPNMPPIRSAGPGAISFGYTQGPVGQLQMYSDMARSSSMFDMLNMGEQMQIYQGMAQAQGQITMRNIQYGNQMRDLTINHNRTMEDIARNSARQIESIHRNFAREMKLNQQTNEVNKRSAPPATYERLINASAKIPAEERKRIDQEYVNDRNEANRLGVFNYEMFMKEFQNEDPELAALVTEYQAIDPTDYAAREDFFQNRLRPRVAQLLPTIQQRWETAEGPEKERLGTLITALTADPQRADKFLQAADTKANESLRRAEVKADAERQLKDLKLSEEQIRNQISDQEKNIREKGPTMTEAERRDADLQLRMSKNELTNNLAAQAAANAQIEGVTSTLPLYQDSVKETWNSIVMDSTTALAQLRTNLNEYQITLKQQIEDAELQLGRSKEDVIRQFTDAAVEISQTVPEEFKKGLDAIMAYNSARTQAEILYMSAQNYDTSTPEGAKAAANTLANARLVMANGTRAAFEGMGYSEADMNQLVAASTAPYSSVVGRATMEPGNKATRLSEFETGLSKYASPYNRNALQVVIVEGKKPIEVPGETGGNNQEDLSQNGVVIYGPGR